MEENSDNKILLLPVRVFRLLFTAYRRCWRQGKPFDVADAQDELTGSGWPLSRHTEPSWPDQSVYPCITGPTSNSLTRCYLPPPGS